MNWQQDRVTQLNGKDHEALLTPQTILHEKDSKTLDWN